jgi:hypothetical protein
VGERNATAYGWWVHRSQPTANCEARRDSQLLSALLLIGAANNAAVAGVVYARRDGGVIANTVSRYAGNERTSTSFFIFSIALLAASASDRSTLVYEHDSGSVWVANIPRMRSCSPPVALLAD